MGYVPPHQPDTDPVFSLVRARVTAVDGARVTLEVREVLRRASAVGWAGSPEQDRTPSPIPTTLTLTFGPTRSTGQEAFYIRRAQLPDEAERLAALAARPPNVPQIGREIVIPITEIARGAWTVTPDEPRWREPTVAPTPRPSMWQRIAAWLRLR